MNGMSIEGDISVFSAYFIGIITFVSFSCAMKLNLFGNLRDFRQLAHKTSSGRKRVSRLFISIIDHNHVNHEEETVDLCYKY